MTSKYFEHILPKSIDDYNKITHYKVSDNYKIQSRNRIITYYRLINDDICNISNSMSELLDKFLELDEETITNLKEEIFGNNSQLSDLFNNKLILEYDDYISHLEHKNSASDSEEKNGDTSDTSTNSMISTSSEKSLFEISEDKVDADKIKILNSEFLSDVNFNIISLGKEIGSITTITDLLIKAKRCLVFVLQDDTDKCNWYAYYPNGIKQISLRNLNMYKYATPHHKKIKLGSLVMHYRPYGFIVENMNSISNISLLNNKQLQSGGERIKKFNPPDPVKQLKKVYKFNSSEAYSIYKYDIDLPLTHIFIHYKFDTEKVPYCNTGKELIEEYKGWKFYFMSLIKEETDKEWYEKVHNDSIFSSKGFTMSVPIGSETSGHKIYRKEQTKERWRIYRN